MNALTGKKFNVTGLCNPKLHYMVDTSEKINIIIRSYINQGAYFTLNRARQYGKTTTLSFLERELEKDNIVIRMSFEGKSEYFASSEIFAGAIRKHIINSVKSKHKRLSMIWDTPVDQNFPMSYLQERITEFCESSDKNVVLMIDEVDHASDFDVFLDFLGMLREMYLARVDQNIPAFQSVILAGVHDIKNLKRRIRPREKHSYNSPWNIAAECEVDLSFSPSEIVTMLNSYENDHTTGMDANAVAERIFYYTNGYPYLVSSLCKIMDDASLNWSPKGVDKAEGRLLKKDNSLFDDVIKNIENIESFSNLVRQVILGDTSVTFEKRNPVIDLGVMYGILIEKNGKARISNIIFETVIYDYLISVSETRSLTVKYAEEESTFIRNDKLDVDSILRKFAKFMRSEYRDRDSAFIERQGRLLFLSFLKPIINGTGHYAVEPETRGSRRMDIVVFFGGEEYVIELKIWRGEKAAERGYEQLIGYLESRGQTKGFMLSFTDNKKLPRSGKTFLFNGFEISETIVAYRDWE
ncbi:MAG: ATP-binding protein [Clostridiales bacterium]|jgi:hypothetical protein|nr:ATP-binding protein [Clostridiales bacterium]